MVLLQLPAAQTLSEQQALKLISTAVGKRLSYSVQVLCGLPAARDITLQTLVQLLQDAVRVDGPGMMKALCALPMAKQLTAADLVPLLQVSVVGHTQWLQDVSIMSLVVETSLIPQCVSVCVFGVRAGRLLAGVGEVWAVNDPSLQSCSGKPLASPRNSIRLLCYCPGGGGVPDCGARAQTSCTLHVVCLLLGGSA